jgi:pimeloyl-ACP methyl ester carboxylesterase
MKQQVQSREGNNGSVAAATDQLEKPTEKRQWFSPQATTSPKDVPFMFYLPGMDSSGSGLHRQHESLARLFEVCCFQMLTSDRTPFPKLLEIVENAVIEEAQRRPSSPIYIVGEGLGGALALGIAARNPTLDLLLILVNPATSFAESQLQNILPLLSNLLFELPFNVPSSFLNFAFGGSFEAPQATVPLSGVGVELSKDTLVWKLKMMQQAAAYANSRLHAVKAEVLVLASDKDQVLPSSKEADKLKKLIKGCRIRKFPQGGHNLLQEADFDLATVIKAAGCYRHAQKWDPVTDYVKLTDQEVAKYYDTNVRMIHQLTSPVFFSTSPEGEISQGLANVPTDRPIMLVGYHMFLGIEIGVVVSEILKEKNILLRGLAHPGVVLRDYEGDHQPDPANGDLLRLFGAVPSYGRTMYKLLQQGNSTLLYPGGTREALHRKGEAYKLFWPERSEFVQMAVRHGVTIIPFGGVGEDDFVDIVLDLHDLRKFPALLDMVTPKNMPMLRQELGGELADQAMHLPIALPKGIGRLYFKMQKPIITAGREEEFRDRTKVQELYMHVKSEVESAMEYLQKKREEDPYRYFLQRALYESPLGHNKQAPTFKP